MATHIEAARTEGMHVKAYVDESIAATARSRTMRTWARSPRGLARSRTVPRGQVLSSPDDGVCFPKGSNVPHGSGHCDNEFLRTLGSCSVQTEILSARPGISGRTDHRHARTNAAQQSSRYRCHASKRGDTNNALRALARFHVACTKSCRLGVDTPEKWHDPPLQKPGCGHLKGRSSVLGQLLS